jgi:MYXO-CTERM domain-containing protein
MPDAWIGSEGAIRGDADASGAPALDGEGSANSDDPKTAGADDLSSEEGDGASESGGGCSVATGVPGGGGAAWLLAFLGLIPFWRRRRSRRNVVA